MRAGRGAGFAAAALGLGIGAHLAGGGALPGLGTVVFLAIPVIWMSFFLTRARRRWPVIVGSLVAVETGLHAGLSLLSQPAGNSVPLQAAGELPVVMGGHAGAIGEAAALVTSTHGMVGMPMVPGFAMVTAHLIATVLTGVALAYGEHLLWCLWTWLHHAVTVTVAVALSQLPPPWTVMPRWLPTVSPVPALVDRSIRRRGPPRLRLGLPAAG